MKVAVLASGAGSTFEALVEAERAGDLQASVIGLIVDRECAAIARATRLGVPFKMHSKKVAGPNSFPTLLEALEYFSPDLVMLCGYLRKVPADVVQKYKGRIFNSHPALLPRHGGPGFFGRRVHESVFSSGDTETGVSFHHVTENYDEGPVFAQAKIAVSGLRSPEEIEARVKGIEKEFLISQLNRLATDWHLGRQA